MFASNRLSRLTRVLRYAVVAGAAFAIGSGTVVAAAVAGVPVGSLFYVPTINDVATTPCSSVTKKAGTTTTCTAVVDSTGQLAVADAGAQKSLSQLTFDGGNLKVSSQGTSTISGTVSVSNFPATQNVNVTGGTLTAMPTVATKAYEVSGTINPKGFGYFGLPAQLNVSYVHIESPDDAVFKFHIPSSGGGFFIPISRLNGETNNNISFTQPISVDAIGVYCQTLFTKCSIKVDVVGS